MNQTITMLFANNGINNGDVVFKTKDDVDIKCHKFVLLHEITNLNFLDAISNSTPKAPQHTFDLNYMSEDVMYAINLLYNLDYDLAHVKVEQFFDIRDVLAKLGARQMNKFDEVLRKNFGHKITVDKFVSLFQRAHSGKYTAFLQQLKCFFYDNILSKTASCSTFAEIVENVRSTYSKLGLLGSDIIYNELLKICLLKIACPEASSYAVRDYF